MRNYDTASEVIKNLGIKAQPATNDDLAFMAEWLNSYELDIDDKELAQSIANAVAFIDKTIEVKIKARMLAEAKREYAQANGLKVSQVRIKRA
jgi:hypothetical protein